MAAKHEGVPSATRQSLLAGGVINFALEDGHTGVIAPEERRTYDHIIHSNSGNTALIGLTDAQVKLILSKSSLSDNDLEYIWSLTTKIQAEGLPDGYWTQLEVYVALHFVQSYERLNLRDMAVQFVGTIPPVVQKITRRSSYAQAGLAHSNPTNDQGIPAELPLALSRTQSVGESSALSASVSLQHANADASASAPMPQLPYQRTVKSLDDSFTGQAGLEAMDPIQESKDWEAHSTSRTPIPSNPLAGPAGVDAMLRGSSVKTNTVDRAETLARLIKRRCPDVVIGPDIEAAGPRVADASTPDRTHAHDLLVIMRTRDPKYKDPSSGLGRLKSKYARQKASDSHNWIFGHSELSQALKEAVDSGHVGVAEALLDKGANVNSLQDVPKHSLKGFRQKVSRSTPTNFIQTAASSNNVEMVNLLASRGVIRKSLEEALEKAVKQNLPKVVLVLLQYGADPNAMLGTIFRSAVTSQSSEVVSLLLRAPNKVSSALLTASLPIAVSHGHTKLVALLIAYGADVNGDHASGLGTAVRAHRIDLVLAIMKGKPTGQAVSSVIEDTVSVNSSITVPERYLLIEILLCGGATGDPVARTLVQIVRAGHRGIAKLLVLHGASLQYNRAEALELAVKNENVAMLRTLLLGDLHQESANQLFSGIPHPFSKTKTYNIMSALISKGATGEPLAAALVAALQQKLLNITKLLLDHNASVDYNDAQAIQIAVSASDLDAFHLLFGKGRPQPRSMQYLLPLVPSSPARLRYDMMKTILNVANPTSIPSAVLDRTLVKVVDDGYSETDINLVNLITVAGADVGCLNGICFQSAVKRGSIELLRLLLGRVLDVSSLSPAVAEAMKLEHPELRRRIIAMIFDHGGEGTAVSQALIDALRENPVDEDLILLLLKKANVDYGGGQVLSNAIQCCTIQMLTAVMEIGKPNDATRLAALPIALTPAIKGREHKLNVLIEAGISQRGLNTALVQEINNGTEKNMKVIAMLLFHQASCNHNNGKALRLAISQRDNKLLEILVASKPDPQILASMIQPATDIVNIRIRYKIMSILLQGGAKGDHVSVALAREILDARECDLEFIRLLIQYGADVGYLHAAAIKSAVSKPLPPDVLKVLVTGKGAANTLPSLIPLAMTLEEDKRLPLIQILLETGACGNQVDAALAKAVSEGALSQTTVELLLQYNASVDFENGKAIRSASAAGLSSILKLLLQRGPRLGNLIEALPLAMQTSATQSGSNVSPRLSCVRLLTQAGVKGLDVVHRALIQAVQEHDHTLAGHLLQSGGNANFEKGASVTMATQQADISMLRLLAGSKPEPTPQVFSNAYSVALVEFERWLLEPATFLSINKILLDGGATGPATDEALIRALAIPQVNIASQYYYMILSCCSSLDVDYERGKALQTAARLQLCDVVRNILSRRPSESTLCSAFISVFESKASTETSLVTTLQLFFDHSKGQKWIYFRGNEPSENPLYQCLHRHADKPLLLQCLFDNGCRPDVTIPWTFSDSYGEEETSALLWLLCQDKRADGRIVRTLLERGADASFRTSRSGATPLIVAAYSSQPDLVLQLLETHARPDTEDDLHKTALYYAARVGSLESLKHLLTYKADPNDESLHIAARNANAPMVMLLLQHGASVDLPGTLSCDDRTSLGELCCKADPDADPARIKDSLKAFEQVQPNLQILTHNKSLVLLALDNASPLSMTRALLTVYPYLQQNINSDFNIYNSHAGKCYSPTTYVRHFKCKQRFRDRSLISSHRCCSLDNCPGPRLEKLLRAFGCQDRFWDDKAGANQPVGACGFPPHINEAREIAERIRKRQAEETRKRQQEQDRRAAIQADLDADAEADRRRESERLALIEQQRIADTREHQRQLDAIEEEHRLKAELERRTFNEQQERLRSAAREEDQRIKRRDTQRLATLGKEAKITNSMYKEKQKTIDKVGGMMREIQMSGVGTQQAFGRILGEIEDGPRLLT